MSNLKETRFTLAVFGRYTWGKKKGEVNPNQHVEVTCVGKNVREAVKCLLVGNELPTYKVIGAEKVG